jgi:alpha-L-fucosidase 2
MTKLTWAIVGFLALAAVCSSAIAQAPAPGNVENIVVKRDVVYGRVDGAGLLADIAYPEGEGPFPVIFSVHGGRWRGGSKTDASTINVAQWAGFGMFAMSIDYRLVGCTPAPACYQDMLCGIRWLHANAAEYKIDRERIFLIGQSAGGHMVSLANTLGDGPFKKTGGWEDQPLEFRAVISVAAPYELVPLSWGTLWTPPGEEPDVARHLASPLHHLSDKIKPMLVIHSDDDRSVPIQQAVDMDEALRKAKAPYRFVHYTNKGHMGITADIIQEARAFIGQQTASKT